MRNLKLKFVITAIFSQAMLVGCSNPFGGSAGKTDADFRPGLSDGDPVLSSVSPPYGDLNGGTLITLTGAYFTSLTTVKVGGADCTPVTFVSKSTMTCTTPAHTAATVDVTITNEHGKTTASLNAYTYQITSTLNSPLTLTSVGGISTGAGIKLKGKALPAGSTVQPTGTGMKLKPTP